MKIDKIKYSDRHLELIDKRNELGARLAQVTADALALSRQEQTNDTTPVEGAIEQRLAKIMGQEVPPPTPSRLARLSEMAGEIRDLRDAVDFLDAQILVERNMDETAYRAGIAPDFRKKVRAVVLAMKTVHAANLELQEIVDAIENQGMALGSLLTHPPHYIGHPRDTNGTSARFFRDSVEIGAIEKHEFPKELLPQ
jgi:hypothetical protein